MNRTCQVVLLATLCGALAGCAGGARTEVIVLGAIHDKHLTSERYGIDTVRRIIRNVAPDVVLCEIPPDRLETALAEFRATGVVAEPRVRRFPEYVEALFPLTHEMGYQIVPCAAWTRVLADDRTAKLKLFETTRPSDLAEATEAMDWAADKLEAEGMSADPDAIHTDRYDQIVRLGMEPYDRLFNDALGAGGWENINAAHWALIERALDQRRGDGVRVLIIFGAWHKYWFLDRLRQRDDIELRSPSEFLPRPEPQVGQQADARS